MDYNSETVNKQNKIFKIWMYEYRTFKLHVLEGNQFSTLSMLLTKSE